MRKSAITGNIWNTGSKPYWLHALFPLLVKEKRKKNPGAWISLDVYLNKFLAECKALLRNEKRTEWQF